MGGVIRRYEIFPKSKPIVDMIASVQKGFDIGLIPKLTLNGTSGTYLLQNKNRKTTVCYPYNSIVI